MKGKILDFSLQRSSGIISADNGSRYDFHISEWRENATPERGMLVDFGVNNENHAVAIYLEQEVQEIKPTRAMQPEKRIKPTSKPVSQNENGVLSLWDYAIGCVINKYVDFNGRARHKEFWGFHLFYCIAIFICMILAVIGASVSETASLIMSIPYYLLILGGMLPQIAVSVRRLHDVGKSGWWFLISLIPIVGAIWLLVLYCQDSNPDENQYGENPKY
jgi:inner membrane protein yhaI